MLKFDISATKNATEAGNRLVAGIHKAKFLNVERGTLETKDGEAADVVKLNLDVEGYGPYSQNFFIPSRDEDAQRTEGMYGDNPSRVEHFLIAMSEIISAVAPEASDAISKGNPIMVDDEEIKMSGVSIAQFINGLKKIVNPHEGAEVDIKLLPQSNGFVSLPSFCARVTKRGDLGIQTTFIGHDLTLSPAEVRRIEAAKNARPTNMASSNKGSEMINALRDDLKGDEDSDLPF